MQKILFIIFAFIIFSVGAKAHCGQDHDEHKNHKQITDSDKKTVSKNTQKSKKIIKKNS